MPDFEHQRIVFEAIQQLRKIDALVVRVLERPWKLKQQCTQLSGAPQGVHSFPHLFFIVRSRLAALMRENAVKFSREHEIASRGHATSPRFCGGNCERTIETAVDFNGVKESR